MTPCSPPPVPSPPEAAPLGCVLGPVGDPAALGRAWRDLEGRADGSFFLSWHWLGAWLAALPAPARPGLLTVTGGGRVLGLALIGRRRLWRGRLLPARACLLNETGDRRLDAGHIEDNGILAERGREAAVTGAALAHLLERPDTDCVSLARIGETPRRGARAAAAGHGRVVREEAAAVSPVLDLAAVRASPRGLAGCVSRGTRGALAQARRRAEALGPVRLERAGSVDQALAMLDGLERLHQAAWRRRGQPGAFADPFFKHFHRRLLAAAVPAGAAGLHALLVGNRPAGYLYSFYWRGAVLSYQSGFDLGAGGDNHWRPGLLSHALAIEDSARAGFRTYDFLAGDSRYKRALSSGLRRQSSLELRRDGPAERLEQALRRLKSRLAPAKQQPTGSKARSAPGQ